MPKCADSRARKQAMCIILKIKLLKIKYKLIQIPLKRLGPIFGPSSVRSAGMLVRRTTVERQSLKTKMARKLDRNVWGIFINL